MTSFFLQDPTFGQLSKYIGRTVSTFSKENNLDVKGQIVFVAERKDGKCYFAISLGLVKKKEYSRQNTIDEYKSNMDLSWKESVRVGPDDLVVILFSTVERDIEIFGPM